MGIAPSRDQPPTPAADLTSRVKQAARDSGFSLVGVASLRAASHPQEFSRWYAARNYGSLGHIFERNEARLNPSSRHPWAKSVVSLGVQYDEKGCAEPTEAESAELASLTLRPRLPSKPGCDDLEAEGWRMRNVEARRRSAE